jgi:ABC-type dipeptide/oligopeptide/nickel transport system permease subunit
LTNTELRTQNSKLENPLRTGLLRLTKNRLAQLGFVILSIVIVVALFAPLLASQHPNEAGIYQADPRNNKQAPSMEHLMGTDDLGRDLLSLVMYGARISLLVGFFAVGFAILFGTSLGAIAGFFGGRIDNIIMRTMDIMLAFPTILLAMVIVVGIGPGLFNAMIAVGIVSIPTYARITRATVLGESNKEYVQSAKALGASRLQILWQHVLPNSLSPLIVAASLGLATAILDAAGLGFLGLGAQPPTPEWGLMLSRNKNHIFTSPWMVFFPGVAIMFLVLGFNLLGDGLRDAFDPKLKQGKK